MESYSNSAVSPTSEPIFVVKFRRREQSDGEVREMRG
jgi:hypothetical protein